MTDPERMDNDIMAKQPENDIDESRRDFLKKSSFAAYTTPAILSIVVSKDAAAYTNGQMVRYRVCIRFRMRALGWDYAKAESYCRIKHLA